MEVQIISKEKIKPSCPTPDHLKTHKLSIIDQLAIQCYVPVIIFYSPSHNQDSSQISTQLKKSLSETLTHFYPLAGKAINGSFIDCNDDGASFVEANIVGDMSMVLNQSKIELLRLLLPSKLNENFAEKEIVSVQVNYFTSGGIVISVCIKHLIADASTVASFVEVWGNIARCATNSVSNGIIFDRTGLFPPVNNKIEGLSWVEGSLLPETVTKRFLFDGLKIAALREMISNGVSVDQPTRFEAVSALIWGASISAARESEENVDSHVAVTVVNLRKKLNPNLPQQCIGNICQVAIAKSAIEKSTDYRELVRKIRKSIGVLDDGYVRKFHAEGKWFDFVKKLVEEPGNNYKVKQLNFSSWCRFPFYGVDFGWGKPIWVSTVMEQENGVIFLDTIDGQGIEAWISLSRENMDKFEKNPEILEFATFNRSTVKID
ncbi:hypothetical protein JCGZ_24898 [Jatropha curcas]|uniref:Uncharacterized protein n=1 Tax=Jatropha curcas TaxID=180498 RepID=A0A067L9V4_JATCU|nr:stemmadenine O-acetyltransferase [Jatropha curcas]KDP40899.1 hypothetical protein JCGZ_24898 [Jatropha curcas]